MPANQNKERYGCQHENYRRPGRQLGKQVRRSTRTKGCLRSLPAKSTSEVSTLSLLEKHNADQKEADDDVNRSYEVGQEHECMSF